MHMVTGSACPGCGCEESTVLERRNRWGATVAIRKQCSFCGRIRREVAKREEVEAKPAPVEVRPQVPIYIAAVSPACPECGCADSRITQTIRPHRRHKCQGCGASFKSLERPA